MVVDASLALRASSEHGICSSSTPRTASASNKASSKCLSSPYAQAVVPIAYTGRKQSRP